MKQEAVSPEEAVRQIWKIFKERGTEALEIAKKEILGEKIQCKEAREALNYFMTIYWQDLARPSLMSLVCEAIGGNPELTTPIAVPMILISGAIDIHDDIIDQSKNKDRRPTVYGKFGKDVALLVGDALLFKGLSMINMAVEEGVPAEKLPLIMNIIKDMFFELGDAEAMELRMRGRIDLLPERYLCTVGKKAADVEAHTRISAILGGGSNKQIDALGGYGRALGKMIILRDDLIDLIDLEESRTRIKRECLPLPILYGLKDPQAGPKLKSILSNETPSKRDAQRLLETVYHSKAMEHYKSLMDELAESASSKLSSIEYDKQDLTLLIEASLPPLEELRKRYGVFISTRT
jgi:geranylgeranyl diphosphate synthase type I